MRYYFSRYIGAGTESDPYRPSGADEVAGWSAIDLRPPRSPDGFAVFATPVALSTSPNRVTLTDDPDDASGALVTRISNRLGVNLEPDPRGFRRLVTRLLLEHGDDANPNRWNRLRPADGRYEIWLGGLLDMLPVVAGGAVAVDDFNRADSPNMGPNWIRVSGAAGNWSILNNEASASAGTSSVLRHTAALATDNHYIQAPVTAMVVSGSGLLIRQNVGAPDDEAHMTAYYGKYDTPGAAWQIAKFVAGAFTLLGTVAEAAPALPFTKRLQAIGSSVVLGKSGAMRLSVTDTAITGNVRVGVRSSLGTSFRIADFFASDIAFGSYLAQVLADNPFAFYRKDDTSGLVMADSSGNGRHGSYPAAPATPALNQPGALNSDPNPAVKYDGVNDYASTPLFLGATNAITIEFWMLWSAFANDDKLAMEFTPNFNAVDNGFIVNPSSSGSPGKVSVGTRNNAQGANNSQFDRPSAGVWHHYAFVMDRSQPAATQVVPYVDAVAVPYTKAAANALSGGFANDTLYLMSRAGASLFCAPNSLLDEVAIYSYALSPARILAHYNAGVAAGLAAPRSLGVGLVGVGSPTAGERSFGGEI